MESVLGPLILGNFSGFCALPAVWSSPTAAPYLPNLRSGRNSISLCCILGKSVLESPEAH